MKLELIQEYGEYLELSIDEIEFFIVLLFLLNKGKADLKFLLKYVDIKLINKLVLKNILLLSAVGVVKYNGYLFGLETYL